MTAIARQCSHASLPLLRYGFRPFFLGAGLWSIGVMTIRIADVEGDATNFMFGDPLLWHAHEMLFGYASAVVGGFALTAVSNWTGRPPITGLPLLALFAAWIAGRLALLLPLPPPIAAAIDVAFLPVLATVLAREIIAGRNFRNIPICALILSLAAANVMFHLEALELIASAGFGSRMGVSTLVLLIGVIGGRIVPSFTNNWLARQHSQWTAAADPRLNRIVHFLSGVALLAWIAMPIHPLTGAAFLAASVAHAARFARWRGWRTLREPLVAILHVGYAWIPVGFFLIGSSILFEPAWTSAGLHALAAGAIGTMTLAVMTRATLGHTGRELHAGVGTIALYATVSVSAILRIAAVFLSTITVPLLIAAGLCWIAAFTIFVAIYGPMHLSPRVGNTA